MSGDFLSKLHAMSSDTIMSGKTILIWFRNDLRIHDNEMLIKAIAKGDNVLPVYCFDPRYFGKTSYGTQKSGYLRTQFLIQSIAALKNDLQSLGGDLLIEMGKPEDVLPALCGKYKVSEVYHHREVAEEETSISGMVETMLWKDKINLKHFIGHTLFHKEDLPFPIKNIPNTFVAFKRKIDRESIVRYPFKAPEKLEVPDNVDWGTLPVHEELGVQRSGTTEETGLVGGEKEGVKALMQLILSETSKEPAPDPILSPWLSLGCLSPRMVYWKVKDELSVRSDLAVRILNELLWRDYNRFMLKKHGSPLLNDEIKLTSAERSRFNKWREGNTGELLVDVCIRELNETGHVNDRCELFLSSCMMNKMNLKWPVEYAYFQEKAIGFAPALIWGRRAMAQGIFSFGKRADQNFDDIMHDPQIKRRLEILEAG